MLKFDLQTPLPLSPAELRKIARELSTLPVLKRNACRATLALISEKNIRDLNRTFRGKNKPADILSFPQHAPKDIARAKKSAPQGYLSLGDILLCGKIVAQAARKRKIPLKHHVTHLVVHGVLHLLGYDHMKNKDARRMERLEKTILGRLGIPDPYLTHGAARKSLPKNPK